MAQKTDFDEIVHPDLCENRICRQWISQSNHLVYINIVILFQFYNHGQKSGDRFPLVCPTPPPTPFTTLNACIHNFSRVWNFYSVGAGELQYICQKDSTAIVKLSLQKRNYWAFVHETLLSLWNCSVNTSYHKKIPVTSIDLINVL